jgi:hypothetical protein
MMPLMLFIIFIVTAPFASANDELFRCEDGTFTNRADLLCKPYESTGSLMVAPEGSRPAQFAPYFEQRRSSVPPMVSTRPEAQTATSEVCTMYHEYTMLSAQTGGGVTFRNTQDIPRWLSLARMFTAIGHPQCE